MLCLSFPPQCPSGQLKLNSLQVERMIEGIGHVLFSTGSQTDNGEDPLVTFGELL